jgi:hypothetical protein
VQPPHVIWHDSLRWTAAPRKEVVPKQMLIMHCSTLVQFKMLPTYLIPSLQVSGLVCFLFMITVPGLLHLLIAPGIVVISIVEILIISP